MKLTESQSKSLRALSGHSDTPECYEALRAYVEALLDDAEHKSKVAGAEKVIEIMEKRPSMRRPVGRCFGCFHNFNLGPCGGCGAVEV